MYMYTIFIGARYSHVRGMYRLHGIYRWVVFIMLSGLRTAILLKVQALGVKSVAALGAVTVEKVPVGSTSMPCKATSKCYK